MTQQREYIQKGELVGRRFFYGNGGYVDWDKGLGIVLGLSEYRDTAYPYYRLEVYWQQRGKKEEMSPERCIRVRKKTTIEGLEQQSGEEWELVGIGGKGELTDERTIVYYGADGLFKGIGTF